MAGFQTNSDLPLSWRRPGTYLKINLNNPGSAPGRRLLLLGERVGSGSSGPPVTTAGARASAVLYRADSKTDVDTNSGKGSVLGMMYDAAIAQVGGGTCETWIGQVDEYSSGAAAVFNFKITASPTASGYVNWSLCGRTASTGFTSSDTATTIGDNLVASAQVAFQGLPVTSIANTAGVIVLTLKTKAAWGEDMPSTFYVTPGLGVSVGVPIVFAVNATGAGSASVTVGRDVYTFALAGGETPTVIAAGLAAAMTGDGPITATASTGTLSVVFSNDWPIRHVTSKITSSTGTTITVNGLGGAVAAGTDAPNGTLGTGSPTTSLAALLTAISAQSLVFKAWACPWNDATTLGTIDTVIETLANGVNCRGQTINFASTAGLATAGAIPAATTPALTATVRARLGWLAFECGNAAFEYAARFAAAQVVTDVRVRKNMNGLVLLSTPTCPLVGPPASGRSPSSDINSAINSYGMAPIVWDDNLGRPVVEHSRTTSNSSDRALHKWSLIAQLDEQSEQAILRFNGQFPNASLMPVGIPFSEGIVTLVDFEDFMYQLTSEWQKAGFYYGADELKDGIRAQQNGGDPSRIDLIYTATALPDVDTISVVASRGTP